MFVINDLPIDPHQLRHSFQDQNSGAMISFEGLVRRDAHHNTTVSSLQYLADIPACTAEGNQIIQEAMAQFPITHAVCVQRIGHLTVGETAVWIGVWAGHRDEAYQASRFIIEEIKKRLHVWKKEFFQDGTKQWIYGQNSEIKL